MRRPYPLHTMSSTSQLQQAMAALRLSLAEIRHKEEQLDASIAQFRTQLRRLPRQTIYGRAPLDMALSAMGEIEERLRDAEDNRRRLLTIKQAAEDELAALESVQQVDEARKALARLKQQAGRQPMSGETAAEIKRLEQFIAIHSKRAELTITAALRNGRTGVRAARPPVITRDTWQSCRGTDWTYSQTSSMAPGCCVEIQPPAGFGGSTASTVTASRGMPTPSRNVYTPSTSHSLNTPM